MSHSPEVAVDLDQAELPLWLCCPSLSRAGSRHHHRPVERGRCDGRSRIDQRLSAAVGVHRPCPVLSGENAIPPPVVGKSSVWRRGAGEVESGKGQRVAAGRVSDEARKLLHYHTSCRTYLGRLARRYPERFRYKRSCGDRLWVIKALPDASTKAAQDQDNQIL